MTLTMLIRWWTSSDHGLDTHSYWVWWDYCHSPQKYLLSWVEPQNLRHPPGQRLELLLSLQTAGGSGDSPLEWKEGREQVRWRQSQTKLIQKKNSLNNKHYSSKLLSTKKSSQGVAWSHLQLLLPWVRSPPAGGPRHLLEAEVLNERL